MIAALLMTLLAVPGELDGLGGPQTTPFVAPGQLFQIGLPNGWTPYSVDKDPNAIQFNNIPARRRRGAHRPQIRGAI